MNIPLHQEIQHFLTQQQITAKSKMVFLTGSGVSTESGIPTFRGKEGYWTIGSKVYLPQEIATFRFFTENPWEVWNWYLHRYSICQKATVNLGHQVLSTIEKTLGNRFTLITQNIDGLHLRAGNSQFRTYEIHGNINYMRCATRCSYHLIPQTIRPQARRPHQPLTTSERKILTCPKCNGITRPHVLWFDEYYEEELYRSQSSLQKVKQAQLLVTVGTSGTTNLPGQLLELATKNQIAIIDTNLYGCDFSKRISRLPFGLSLKTNSSTFLAALACALHPPKKI